MLFLVFLLLHGACAYTVKQPSLSLLSPQGLRISYPADSGVTLVAFHYSVDRPLSGVQAGNWNYDVWSAANGQFVHENTRVSISPGQTLNYWVHVVKGGVGYNLLDQSWTAGGSSGGSNTVDSGNNSGSGTSSGTSSSSSSSSSFSGVGTYIGCFNDDGNDRDFPYSVTLTYTNGISTCTQHCAGLGYRYIGLQYAIECFCGNSYGKHGAAAESECYYGCSGGTGGKCGGDYRNSVWDISGSTGTTGGETGGTTDDNLQLVFEDDFNTLDTSKWRPEVTAGGGGNEEFQYYLGHPDNLYVRDGNLFLKPTLASEHYGEEFLTQGYIDFWHGYNYIGCYHDYGITGLSESPLTAGDMNPGKCVTHCASAGYEYFGLKGTECRCGNSNGSGRAAINACHTSCPGDSGKSCGGSGVTSVYGQTFGDCTSDFPSGRACFLQGSSHAILPPIQSARVTTVESFSFKYGKVEVWAKLPTGDWIWPAIWLLPRDNVYGGWPASGEIDIMESRGNRNLYNGGNSIGVDDMGSTLHWGPFWPHNGYHLTTNSKHAKFGTYGSDFHKWVLTWTDSYLRVEVDDDEVLLVSPPNGFWNLGNFPVSASQNPWAGRGKMAPFDQEFYLIFNVAVGGTNSYFPDGASNQPYPKPWNNGNSREGAMRDFWNAKNQWYPTWNGEDVAMQIRSIKVWKFV